MSQAVEWAGVKTDGVWFDPDPLNLVLTEAPAYSVDLTETGGYLFGYRYDDNSIRVLHATGPGPNAARTWNSLGVDHEHSKLERSRIYGLDEYCIEVGAWHTHPPYYQRASSVDDSTAWWTLENWKLPVWYEFIVIVDKGGKVLRIMPYRYEANNVKRQLPDLPITRS